MPYYADDSRQHSQRRLHLGLYRGHVVRPVDDEKVSPWMEWWLGDEDSGRWWHALRVESSMKWPSVAKSLCPVWSACVCVSLTTIAGQRKRSSFFLNKTMVTPPRAWSRTCCWHNLSGAHYWCLWCDPSRKPMRRMRHIWSPRQNKPIRTQDLSYRANLRIMSSDNL
jgi:hypothetical protein